MAWKVEVVEDGETYIVRLTAADVPCDVGYWHNVEGAEAYAALYRSLITSIEAEATRAERVRCEAQHAFHGFVREYLEHLANIDIRARIKKPEEGE